MLSEYCSEFLVHAADVEGLCQGIDEELVTSTYFLQRHPVSKGPDSCFITDLGKWCQIPCTYAGGGKGMCSQQDGNYDGPMLKTMSFPADISDLALVEQLSGGKVDLTYGRFVQRSSHSVNKRISSRQSSRFGQCIGYLRWVWSHVCRCGRVE